jgi:hypothetical protein
MLPKGESKMIAAYVTVWIAIGGITTWVANAKGRAVLEGVLLGFILGIIGLIIEIFLPSRQRQAARYARMDSARRPARTNEGLRISDLKKDREGQ